MRRCLLALVMGLQSVTAAFAGDPPAEVMHFWISGSERAALDVIRGGFTARGGTWIDSPQMNDLQMRQVLMQRLTSGTAPTALQWHGGVQLSDMASTGLISDIDGVAKRGEWDKILPAAVKSLVTYDGHYYLAPTGIHTENWLFYNVHVLDEHGIQPPRTWADLIAATAKLEAAGVVPIALGPSDWEGRVLWSSVLLGKLGRENFRRLFQERDVSMLDRPEALDALRLFMQLSRQIGPTTSRPADWAQATANLASGHAAFQFQGDWVKGELQKRGLVLGRDFGCVLAPGSEDTLAIVIDAFAFPRSVDDNADAARTMMASTIMDPEVQIGFNAIKGSVPARLDTPPARLDACARTSLELLSDPGSAVSPPAQALDTAGFGDVEALIHRMLNDQSLTPEMALAALKDVLRTLSRS